MTPETASPALPPHWVRVGGDLWHNLAGLLGANTVFLAWCAPAALLLMLGLPAAAGLAVPLTVGPGLTGLAAYAGRLALGLPASLWRDSLRGAGARFGAGAALGAVAVAALVALRLALGAAGTGQPTAATLGLLASASAAAIVAAMAGTHALGLVGLYGQPAGTALRNGLLLSLRHPGETAGVAGAGLAGLALAGSLGWRPLIIVPAVLTVCATNVTLRLVRMERTAE